MNSLNSVLIEGNLTADPENKVTDIGSVVCTFTIASNRYLSKDGQKTQETSFFNIEAWNRTAELCIKTLSKGRGVRLVGRLKQDRWEGQDGQKHSKVKIVAETVEFKAVFDRKPSEVQEET